MDLDFGQGLAFGAAAPAAADARKPNGSKEASKPVRHADPFLNFVEAQVTDLRNKVIHEYKKVQTRQLEKTQQLQDSIRALKKQQAAASQAATTTATFGRGVDAQALDDDRLKGLRRGGSQQLSTSSTTTPHSATPPAPPRPRGENRSSTISLCFATAQQPEAPSLSTIKVIPEAGDDEAQGASTLELLHASGVLERTISDVLPGYLRCETDDIASQRPESEAPAPPRSFTEEIEEITETAVVPADLGGSRSEASERGASKRSQPAPPTAPPPVPPAAAGKGGEGGEGGDGSGSGSLASSSSSSDSESSEEEERVPSFIVDKQSSQTRARIIGRKASIRAPLEVLSCWTQDSDLDLVGRASGVSNVNSLLRKQSRGSLWESEDEQIVVNWYDRTFQKYVIQPSSRWHLGWEILGLIFVARDIIVIPLQILDPLQQPWNIVMTWLARMCWTIDLFLNFFTGYVSSSGSVETKPTQIARMYTKTRLPIDLTIVLCDWLELASGSASTFSIISMLRAMRLARLARLMKNQKRIFELLIRSEFIMLVASVTAYLLLLLALIHVIACIWYGIQISQLHDGEYDPERAALRGTLAGRYFFSLHVVLALFLSEHVVMPDTLLERVFTVSVLFIAFVISSAFVGSLTTALTRLQIIASQRSAQFAALSNYLADYKIPDDLAMRVKKNARHTLDEQKRNTPEEKVMLLGLISDQLRAEIHYEIYTKELIPHPFFKCFNEANPFCIRSVCHHSVAVLSLSRGDALFAESEVPQNPQMYFVISGKIGYEQSSSTYLDPLMKKVEVHPRMWLAEPHLWTSWVHRGTATALLECRLLGIETKKFAEQVNMYRTPQRFPYRYAAKFVESLNNTEDDELTDLATGIESLISTCVFANETEEPRRPGGGRMSIMGGVPRMSISAGRQSITGAGIGNVVAAMRRTSVTIPSPG